MRIAVPDFVSSTMFPLIAAKELGIFKEQGEDVEIVLTHGLGAVESLRDVLFLFSNTCFVRPASTLSGTGWKLSRRRLTISPFLSMSPPGGRLRREKWMGCGPNVLGCEVALYLGGGAVVVDTRRGDGPQGAGNYSFAALATTETNIETEPERIEAVIRAVVKAQSVLRQDPLRATEVARKLFPAVEAELMGQILTRDAKFYRPSISMEAIWEMNRFAKAVGLLSSPVPYEQVVATQFRGLWSE